VVDPDSLAILGTRDAGPQPLLWQGRAVAEAAATMHSGWSVLRAGAYEVESRNGTIVVRGPDLAGARRTRTVGPGAALAATANAQYILAVAPDSATGRARGVIYRFTLFHYRIESSCDR
jgi:hypothetical protein